MRRYVPGGVLAGLIAVGAGVAAGRDGPSPTPVVRWEYQVLRASQLAPPAPGSRAGWAEDEVPRALNRLGEDGWELAGVLPAPAGETPSPAAVKETTPLQVYIPPGIRLFGRPSDLETAWRQMAGGKDVLDLNDPANAAVKERMQRVKHPLPDDGRLTKGQYTAVLKKVLSDRGYPMDPAGPTFYFKRPRR